MDTLSSAIKNFLTHCRFEKNLGANTLKAYETDLLQLEIFLIGNGKPTSIDHITKHELREYIAFRSSLKPRSIKRKLASIKALFNYLEFEDFINVSPLRKMKISIKEPRDLPKVMELKEVMKIFKVAYDRVDNAGHTNWYTYRESIRNAVIIELLFSTGARVSEIAGLMRENIDLESGSILIKGKGNKERVIHVCHKDSIRLLRVNVL